MNEYVSMLAMCWKGYSKSYQHVAQNIGENVGRKCCAICARFNIVNRSDIPLSLNLCQRYKTGKLLSAKP